MLIGAINLFGSLLSMYTIKNFGRVQLLVWGFFGMAISNFLMGLFLSLKNDILTIATIVVSFLVFTTTVGPIQAIYATETCVDSALGFVTMSIYLFRSAVGYFIPALMLPSSKGGIGQSNVEYLIASLMLLAAIFSYFLIKETKGLPDK